MFEADGVAGGLCPGWSDLREDSPRIAAGARRLVWSSTAGAPPIPMLPSSSSAVPQRPCPGTRSKIERWSTGAPRRRAMVSAGSEMSMPSVMVPDSASARAWRAGPQPMSSTGPSTRTRRRCSAGETGSNHRWAGAGRTRPSSARKRGSDAAASRVRDSEAAIIGSVCVLEAAVRDLPPRARSAWLWRSRRRQARRGSHRRRGGVRGLVCEVRVHAAGRVVAREVCSVLISTLSNTWASGRRSPMPHHPPSTAGPRTASVSGSASVAIAVETSVVSSWGVSMPTRNAGPRISPNACARRSASPCPRWATTSNLAGSHGPGGPSSAMTCRRAGVDASTSRVSVSAAWARTAASSGVHGGHSRVLTRPGCGDLAMMSKVARGLIAALAPCLGRRVRCL